ncbi:MAG: bifunctional folylpolyglutamate synthase/dihydrofolate synthase [Nitrospirae bacterium]|nr:bifunctional folylpolyglutamate synthase/dihydrofolate synthase [Nitrospirota bacterium]
MDYQDIIRYLYNLQKYGIKFGLENTVRLMSLMDNPHLKFKSIHIAGTNGKGSTSAMIASVLQEAGYKVGIYTSPHLVSFTERIRINKKEIPEKRVIELTDEIRGRLAAIEASDCRDKAISPTFFEFTTTMAFAYLAEEKIDIAVIEAGMGGRLDSTNVINPIVSVITPIDYDHEEFLGDAIKDIAYEKAGIIKENGMVVSSPQHDEALDIIRDVSQNKMARLFVVNEDTDVIERACSLDGCRFGYRGIKLDLNDIVISLPGRHQILNAATALLTIEALCEAGVEIGEAVIRDGLKKARWDGRLEIPFRDPLIILDGAHNPAAARRLKEFLQEFVNNKRIILVLGILSDKDIDGILSELIPVSEKIIVTRPDYYRAAEPDELKDRIKRYGKDAVVINNIPDAIRYAKGEAGSDAAICITGSLFTVGEAKAFFSEAASAFCISPIVEGLAGLRG